MRGRTHIQQLGRQSHGQTIVVTVLMVTVIIGFAAVVIDGGKFLLTKRNLQGVADAAALAGVHELPNSSGLATAVAEQYVLTKNDDGAQVDEISITSNDTIDVTVSHPDNGAFLEFMGIEAPTIVADAQAKVSQAQTMSKMLPFALMEGVFPSCITTPCDPTGIKTNGSNSNRGSTNPDFTNPDTPEECLESGGASDFRELIETAENGGADACGMPLGSDLATETGNMTGPTSQGFDSRIGPGGMDGDAFSDIFKWDPSTNLWIMLKPESPRIGIIPLVLFEGGTTWPEGTKNLTIVGYQFVYIGRIGFPGEPAYTGNGVNHEVWFTPLEVLLPEDWGGVTFGGTIDPDSDAPFAYRLTR